MANRGPPASYMDLGPRGTWCLLAPLLKQRYQNQIQDLTTYLGTTKTIGIFERLARIDVPESPLFSALEAVESAPNTKLSALESLPIELLEEIMRDSVLSRQDLVNLGVCSKFLWPRLLNYVREDMRGSSASWSNTPLVCPFLYLRNLPPAMKELLPEVVVQQEAFDRRPPATSSTLDPDPTYLWVKQAFENFERVEEIDARRRWWIEALSFALISQNTPLRIFQALQSALEDALRFKAPSPGEKWVLRNLTTHKYVRFEVADSNDGAGAVITYVETAPWLTLDAALLLCIFWHRRKELVADGGALLLDDIVQHRLFTEGAWAAHCFDVVRCSEPLPADTWKDATEVVVCVARIWRLVFVRSDHESLRKLHAENRSLKVCIGEFLIARMHCPWN